MNKPLNDQTLTTDGLTATGKGRILLLACGALAREILDLIKVNGWSHMDLHCLPAILHVHPEKIPDAVETAVSKFRAAYDEIFVVYADCGTGGLLQNLCDDLGVAMVEGPHCYSFFEGNDAFAKTDEIDCFYLTDFLVRQFDAFIVKPLGLDRHPELRDMYFGNYKTLVYQAQTDDPALTEKAKEHAERLGLAFERRLTGYGDLETTLSALS
ncbi:DUF1638 domain-containing protein [Octadecabacter sp. 1_MG-2023]|uniref:DUF1638 domain-containing protein n=1 Tax=unclassified Octadecabacter TaxID=196158 RepID=UPI001C0A3BAE|nr:MULTISPECIES: DUF1638 domain-containing protein [unclassified Octadecabacter]MBU2993562.1 DUF1638 domain-containing protein [Octadecabacter sp. B2R22]MDO6735594.1 DUF1638 domain-containing protein [Octadecabacter sp. 1_MG-2023]